MLYKPIDASPYLESVDIEKGVVLRVQISGTKCVGAKFLLYNGSAVNESAEKGDSTEQNTWPWVVLNSANYMLPSPKYNGDWVSLYIGPQSEDGEACDFAVFISPIRARIIPATLTDGTHTDITLVPGQGYTWKVLLYAEDFHSGSDGHGNDWVSIGSFGWTDQTGWLPSGRYTIGDDGRTIEFKVPFRTDSGGNNRIMYNNYLLFKRYADLLSLEDKCYIALMGGKGANMPAKSDGYKGLDAYLANNELRYFPLFPISATPTPGSSGSSGSMYISADISGWNEDDGIEYTDSDKTRWLNRVYFQSNNSYPHLCLFTSMASEDSLLRLNYLCMGSVRQAAKSTAAAINLEIQYSNLICPGMHLKSTRSAKWFEILDVASYDVHNAKMTVKLMALDEEGSSFDEGDQYEIFSAFIPSDEYYMTYDSVAALSFDINGNRVGDYVSFYDVRGLGLPRCTLSGIFSPGGTESIASHRLRAWDKDAHIIFDSGYRYDENMTYYLDGLLDNQVYEVDIEARDSLERGYHRHFTIGTGGWVQEDKSYNDVSMDLATRPEKSSVLIAIQDTDRVTSKIFSNDLALPGGAGGSAAPDNDDETATLMVYAQTKGDHHLRHVGDFTGLTDFQGQQIMEDFCVGNDEEIRYYAFYQRGDKVGLLTMTPYIRVNWDGFYVIFLDERSSDRSGEYRAEAVWNFAVNAKEGSVSHKHGYNEYVGLGKYPKIGYSSNDYESGTLETDAGIYWCNGHIEDTLEMQRSWRAYCAAGKMALYKDIKGNVFAVAISAPSRMATDFVFRGYDGRLIVPTTLSFTWTEVADMRDVKAYNVVCPRTSNELDALNEDELSKPEDMVRLSEMSYYYE